jgi:hypothetical protein
MRRALVIIVVAVVAVGSFAAGAWVNESRQDSSTPATTTTRQPTDTKASIEFCSSLDEPVIRTSRLSFHIDTLGDCLKRDR